MNMKLKALIKEKCKTNREFAKRMNVSESAVTNWLSGKNIPNTRKKSRMATVFGVEIMTIVSIFYENINPSE